jgi:PAT family beta-lactamase induction signal transducer AmpG
MVVMLLLGIASGLPFAVITGTLNAWFTEYKISIATIGVFAWAGLAYSFKFLWSPLHRTAAPFFSKRAGRSWFIPIQCAIALCFLGFSLMNPADHFGLIALLAVVAAFLSATFDIVVDAWRIETANSPDDLDTLTTFYQGGYRSAAFIGGAAPSFRRRWNLTLAILACYGDGLALSRPSRRAGRPGDAKTWNDRTFTQGSNLVLLVCWAGRGRSPRSAGSCMRRSLRPRRPRQVSSRPILAG